MKVTVEHDKCASARSVHDAGQAAHWRRGEDRVVVITIEIEE
jgi:hypothetical protein